MNEFYKFPSTPHIIAPHMIVRQEKIMSLDEAHAFLQHNISVEEKIDGANLGISFNNNGDLILQNRGHYINTPYNGQWRPLSDWLALHTDEFFDILADQYILFGEWCYAKHSIKYQHLPDWFIAFDIYDKRNMNFLCIERRNKILNKLNLAIVPFISHGKFEISDLYNLMSKSNYGNNLCEGLYLRLEDTQNLIKRAKIVRQDFLQAIEKHWSKQKLEINIIDYLTE